MSRRRPLWTAILQVSTRTSCPASSCEPRCGSPDTETRRIPGSLKLRFVSSVFSVSQSNCVVNPGMWPPSKKQLEESAPEHDTDLPFRGIGKDVTFLPQQGVGHVSQVPSFSTVGQTTSAHPQSKRKNRPPGPTGRPRTFRHRHRRLRQGTLFILFRNVCPGRLDALRSNQELPGVRR
jgi:hypothetical protein